MAAWFLQQLARYSDSSQYQNGLPGRIQLHVQTRQDPGIVGIWHVYHSLDLSSTPTAEPNNNEISNIASMSQSYWLFTSQDNQYSVLTCPLPNRKSPAAISRTTSTTLCYLHHRRQLKRMLLGRR